MTGTIERRRVPRFRPDDLSGRLRPGHVVRIVDASIRGVLIETGRRLLPGSRVDLYLETPAAREMVKAEVMRCAVCALRPHLVVFRGALQFEAPLAWITSAERRAAGAGGDRPWAIGEPVSSYGIQGRR
jgi:hypothetical protein